MGKNNRQRRAAKARARARPQAPRGPDAQQGTHRGGAPPPPSVAERFTAAVSSTLAGNRFMTDGLLDALADDDPQHVAREVARLLEGRVALAWDRGWEPADLDRHVRRHLDAPAGAVARRVMAAEAAGYADLGRAVAPRWMAQLDDLGAAPVAAGRVPYLLDLSARWRDTLASGVAVMALLVRLPPLPRLGDPPSAWSSLDPRVATALPPAVLARVRALLAKAESTNFEAEAEAFTAKAQELMARHRIDRAMLAAAGRGADEQPVGRRIGTDDPYADAKALLLSAIADANGCRAVWCKELGFSTVFGFADDLDGVDELFTSLLVQATSALRREGPKRDPFGRSRTTRFRRSFLVAFAIRIGERLQATVDATVDAAGVSRGTALVPLLAARDEAARASVEAAFPELRSMAPSATDGEGWYAGRVFADLADLTLDPEVESGAGGAGSAA